MSLRILLAEDHAVVRDGLRAVLEREGLKIVGEVGNGIEAVQQARELVPDIAVLDFDMPLQNGILAAQELGRSSPRTKSILLTMYKEKQYVLSALRAGIRGFVVKSQAVVDLLHAIKVVMAGNVYLSPGISQEVVDACFDKSEPPADPLSSRERQVLQLIAEGRSTKEAARTLGISVKTAESHRTRMMDKLDIHETASLVRYAIRQGMIQP